MGGTKEIFLKIHYFLFLKSPLEQKIHADSKNGLKKVHTILEGPKFRFFLIEVSPEMTIQTFKIVYM